MVSAYHCCPGCIFLVNNIFNIFLLLECPECYGLIQVYFNQLKVLIKEVDRTVKELKERFNKITNNKFAERLMNATTKVNDIYEKANLTANKDPNDLNTTIDVLDNLESDVKQLEDEVQELKQQERELQSRLKRTSNLSETAYNSLQQANTSRPKIEDLRNTIESFIQPLAKAKEIMETLNATLWSTAQNLSTISQQNNMSEVLLDANKVNVQLHNNQNNTKSLQNKTQASLKYSQETFNSSVNFSAQATDIFKTSKDILKTVDRLTTLIEENKDLTKKLNESILRPGVEYKSTIKNTSNSIEESQTQTARADKVRNNTENLLSKMKNIQEQAINTNNSALKTLNDAITTLGILQDFQNISANATKTAGKSLQQINNIKVESNRSIKEIMNVSESVEEGLEHSEEGKKLADDAHDLAYTENQVCGLL